MAVAGMHVWHVHVGWLLQVMVVTADEELLKTLREANKLLEQVCGWQMHACRHADSCACACGCRPIHCSSPRLHALTCHVFLLPLSHMRARAHMHALTLSLLT